MKNILLDTNCYTAYLSGDTRVLEALAIAEKVWMSAVVLGELYGGFKGGTRTQENISRLDAFFCKADGTFN